MSLSRVPKNGHVVKDADLNRKYSSKLCQIVINCMHVLQANDVPCETSIKKSPRCGSRHLRLFQMTCPSQGQSTGHHIETPDRGIRTPGRLAAYLGASGGSSFKTTAMAI